MHLEMRDVYTVESERDSITAWRNGFRRDPADWASWWRPWHDLVHATVARGVVMRRARIVSEPVSEYIRYEYDGTFTNITAGELVRWLPRRRATGIALPGNDFWLFDDETVIVIHFDGNGGAPSDEVSTDADLAKLCASAFEAVWERAIPHEEYHP
ncbi:hypothetical protein DY240_27925 [Jiangella rhizosphaerae]|uniref:DUF6879 domain-containing protein n=1 Tax=Jiangella rhizosphaerae TaxID=2293569 RepID=A0A418KHK2_9ACTN|nr:hypothetical protein DY240_27925 [Jiangella rhizosphaerae]